MAVAGELELIHILQTSGNPYIDLFFKFVTIYIGGWVFYILLILPIYWVYDKRLGIWLFNIMLVTSYINIGLKTSIGSERPPVSYHKVPVSSYGFPSGHAQTSATFWNYLILKLATTATAPTTTTTTTTTIHYRHIISIIGIVVMTLVAVSRVYLGVHYLTDVIGGLILGAVIAYITVKMETKIKSGINLLSFQELLLACIFIPLFMMGCYLLITHTILFEPPHNTAGIIGITAGLIGINTGYLLEQRYVNLTQTNKKTGTKLVRIVLGLVIIFAIVVMFKLFIPSSHNNTSLIVEFGRMLLLSFTAIFLLPYIFNKLEGS